MYRFMLLAVAVFAICVCPCAASERVVMVGPPEEQEIAKGLVEEMVACCNRKQFRDFMSHFTPTRAAAIRKTMEHLFITQDIEMQLLSLVVLSHSNNQLVFGLRYEWAERGHPKRLTCSRITAVRSDDLWQVESEEVLSVSGGMPPAQNSLPGQRLDFGGAGVVVLNPADDFLPRDIGRSAGGCAGGRCGLPR